MLQSGILGRDKEIKRKRAYLRDERETHNYQLGARHPEPQGRLGGACIRFKVHDVRQVLGGHDLADEGDAVLPVVLRLQVRHAVQVREAGRVL